MAVQKKPATYEAGDGTEFDREADAKRHDRLVVACADFDRAVKSFGRVLAETQRTADGKPFALTNHDYYHVAPDFGGMPGLRRVEFYFQNCDFVLALGGNDPSLLVIVVYRGSNRDRQEYKVSDLYFDEKEALKGLLAARKAWLAEQTEIVKQTEEAVAGKKDK